MSDANDILENVISDVKLSRDEWRTRAEAAEAKLAAWAPVVEAAIEFKAYLYKNGDYAGWGPKFYGSEVIESTKWARLLSNLPPSPSPNR